MIIFCDEALNIMSFPVEDFTSFTWEECWTEPGAWSIALNPREFDALKDAAYIYYDAVGWGVVESIEYTRDSFKMGGRELSAILDNYVITTTSTISGNLANEVRKLVKNNTNIAINRGYGFDVSVSAQISRGSLMDTLYTLLTPRGMSFKLSIDVDEKQIVFDVLCGKNRTSYQRDYVWAILSDSKGNIADSKYTRNSRDYKNYVVINVGDDENPLVLEYDFRDVL